MRLVSDPNDAPSAVVERRLRIVDLESGSLSFGPAEAAQLGLPSHQSELAISIGGREIYVVWSPRDRTLTGEALAEFLADEARVGQIVRIHRHGESFELELAATAQSVIDRPRTAGPTTPLVAKNATPVGPRRVRIARKDRYRIRARREFTWNGRVGVSKSSIKAAKAALAEQGWDSAAGYELRLRGEELAAVSGFEELLSADTANVEQMPHQHAAALKVLGSMNGRAILADEVGLGKTIEAGLIASELVLRGLASRLLIICPAGLRDQWKEELDSKFGIECQVVMKGTDALDSGNLIISLQLARRARERLAAEGFDLVIVDEAHKMRGKVSQEMLAALSSRYLLYLTATPVQNSLDELYQLVESLRPGTFRSQSDFRRQFCGDDPRTPSDPEGLRALVRDVMVRTTRAQAGLDSVQRFVTEVPVAMSPAEQERYNLLLDVLRAQFDGPGDHFRRQAYAQRLAASPRSLAVSLLKHLGPDAAGPKVDQLREIAEGAMVADQTERQRRFVAQVKEWVADPTKGKVLVFTQHTEVAEDLLRQLAKEGVDAVPYHGGISATKRRETIASFRNNTPVMISTDAGAEGLNLQFCNCIINYDLPWNPMRIEQRIGRVHRISQTRDVYVANMFAVGTVEDRVYQLLREKLRMFELLFGQITLILGEISEDERGSIEAQIAAAVFEHSEKKTAGEFKRIGEVLADARAAADEEISTASQLSYLSSWDTSHREGLTAAGSEDLRPAQVRRERDRQRDVIEFVIDFLEFIGATVERSTAAVVGDDGLDRQVFVSAELPEELRPAFGDVDRLNIAFHPSGLNQHRDAELCAVGSDLFEELVEHLRTSGDLLIQVPDLELADEPLIPASTDLRYLGRNVLGPSEWQSTGTWRLGVDGVTQSEHVLGVADTETATASSVRDLGPGDTLPATLDVSAALESIAARAVAAAEVELSERDQLAQDQHTREQERLAEHYSAQIEDLQWRIRSSYGPDKDRVQERSDGLKKARAKLLRAGAPRAEGRLDLLALRLAAGTDLVVEERWVTRDDTIVNVELLVDTRTGETAEVTGADGRPIQTLAVCRSAHTVDHDGIQVCDECAESYCGACNQRRTPRACPLCERNACSSCRVDGLCRACQARTPDSELDRHGLLGFRVGGGRALLVGPTTALLDDVPIGGAHWTNSAAAALALEHGLDTDAHIVLDTLTVPRATSATRFELSSDVTSELVVDSRQNAPSGHNPLALDRLGLGGATTDVWPTAAQPTLDLIAQIRTSQSWSDRVLAVKEVGATSFLQLGPSEPIVVTYSRAVEGDVIATSTPLEWAGGVDHRFAQIGDGHRSTRLDMMRLHSSYLLDVSVHGQPSDTFFIPGTERATYESEHLLAAASSGFGPDQPVLYRGPQGECPAPASSASAALVERSIEPFDARSEYDGSQVVDIAGLAAAPSVEPPPTPPTPLPLLGPWARRESLLDPPPRATIERRYRVREVWQGEAELQFEYIVDGDGAPRSPVGTDADFLVDQGAHAVIPAEAHECEVCALHTCAQCDSGLAIGDCPACGQASCGTCRPSAPVSVEPDSVRCNCCERLLCGECGRLERAGACLLCGQLACHLCTAGGICSSCSNLHQASPDEIAALPPQLAAVDHLVLLGSPATKRAVILGGGERRELALLSSTGELSDWRRATLPDDAEHQLLLAAAAGGPVSSIEHIDETPHGPDTETEVLAQHTSFVLGLDRDGVDVLGPTDALTAPGSITELAEHLVGPVPSSCTFDASLGATLEPIVRWHDVPPGTPARARTAAYRHELTVGARGVRLVTSGPHDQQTADVRFAEDGGHLEFELGGDIGGSLEGDRIGDALLLRYITETGDVIRVAVIPESAAEWTHHRRLEQLRDRLALPPRTRLTAGTVDDAAPPERADGAKPSSRSVQTELALASYASPFITPLSIDTVQRLEPRRGGVSEDVRTVVVEDAVFEASYGADTRPHLAVSAWHDCTDTWTDHGSHEVSYRVEGSTPPPAPNLANGSRSWDFVVDAERHLAAPRQLQPCEVCGNVYCNGCGPAIGVDACERCGQPACGECRSTPATAPVTTELATCHVCSSALCPDCGREERAALCEVCEQPTCQQCLSDERCAGCHEFRPAQVEEIRRLPAELHAVGLSVSISTDPRNPVYLVAGGVRREVVVLESEQLRHWRNVSDVDSDLWRLAWLAGGPTRAVRIDMEDAPPGPAIPELVLHDRSHQIARLRNADGAVIVAMPLDATGDARRTIAAAHADLPAPEHEPTSALDDLFTGAAPGDEIAIEVATELDLGWLGEHGLRLLAGPSDGPRDVTIPWEPVKSATVTDFDIEFDDVSAVATHDGSALLAAFGDVRFLAVLRRGAVTQWLRVDSSGIDPRHVALGRLLFGTNQPLTVSTATLPGEPVFLSIANAELAARTVTPVAAVSHIDADPERTDAALGLVHLPNELLEATVVADSGFSAEIRSSSPVVASIGLSVAETWTFGDDSIDIAYEIPAGATEAQEQAFDTFVLTREFIVDQEHHLVTDPTGCSTCGAISCRRCERASRACTVCGLDRCERCGPTLGGRPVCTTCHALQPVKGFKRLGAVGLRGSAFEGTASDRTVKVTVQGDEVVVTVAVEGAEPSAIGRTTDQQDEIRRLFMPPQ